MKTATALLLLGAALAPVAIMAADGAAPETAIPLPAFLITTIRTAALEIPLPKDELRPPEANVSLALLGIPGVTLQARAADAGEPSIRGLGLDRVTTTFNGLPVSNGSPERTNSPVTMIGGATPAEVLIMKSAPSVTLGPVTTAGHIAIITDHESTDAPDRGFVTTTYDGNRDGFTAAGLVRARAGAWDLTSSFFHNDLGDYTAGDGRRVAARLLETGGSGAIGWRSPKHRARAEFITRRLQRQETLSLPLDGKNNESHVLTFNERSIIATGPLESLSWRAGLADADPYITSEDRPAPALIYAKGRSRVFGAGVDSRWRAGSDGILAVGADFSRQNRSAVRTTIAGTDHIWPDAWYEDTGVFGEWSSTANPYWQLRVGARGDVVRSDAQAGDQLALGRPIRDQFAIYNGAAARQLARSEFVPALNAVLTWNRSPAFAAFLTAGWSTQPAAVTERYRAFLNALGGDGRGGNAVELGNPTLESERKASVETGASWRARGVDAHATVYYHRVDDFIWRTRIGVTQPPLAPLAVFGYRNVPAEFWGGELKAALKPSSEFSLPVSLGTANGRNRETGVGLPEMPPWEAAAAVHYRALARSLPFFADVGTRLVGARHNPAPFENPLFASAAGFALWHARGRLQLHARLRFEAGIENLFNRRYSEYLTPPVAPIRPASGDLFPGDRVPGAGRSLWVSFTLTL